MSGGDCCSRGLFIGACIAAKVGVEVIFNSLVLYNVSATGITIAKLRMAAY